MHLKGLDDALEKIRRNLKQGTLFSKLAVEFRRKFWFPLRLTALSLRQHRKLDPADKSLRLSPGFADHRSTERHRASDPAVLERIIRAYRLAKEHEDEGPPALRVRGQWAQWWVSANFRAMVEAMRRNDVAALAAVFENFNREQVSVGLGSGYENFVRYRRAVFNRFYYRTVWCRYRDLLVNSGFAPAEIHSPYVGNPAGLLMNGEVLQIDTFRHLYHAAEIVEWLRDVPKAVIVEIGAGFGGQAWQVLRLGRARIAKFMIFDIPEMAALSAYYLMTGCPELRMRLFGEGEVSAASGEDYDIAVFPHFAVDRLADDSVDLYHNACSLAEMDRASALEYVKIINRTCRRYFSHVNHDNVLIYHDDDGKVSHNLLGSEAVPDPAKFKRLFKKPRVFVLPEDQLEGFRSFEYLYERVARTE